jgi:hypothetical protein
VHCVKAGFSAVKKFTVRDTKPPPDRTLCARSVSVLIKMKNKIPAACRDMTTRHFGDLNRFPGARAIRDSLFVIYSSDR